MSDNYFPFNSKLPKVKDDIAEKNKLDAFSPIRTQGNNFDWSTVIGLVLGEVLRKKIDNYSFDEFNLDCKKEIEPKLSNKDFWSILNAMFFEKEDIYKISPEVLLFKSQNSKSGDKRISSIFANLLQEMHIKDFDNQLNFLEYDILSILRKEMKDISSFTKEKPYLPFLSETFRQDLQFLSKHPKYLLNQIQPFLSFYAFIYMAQLALSLPDWKTAQAPKSKPLYFIMDHERASSERVHIKNHGYKLFHDSCYKIFPYLTMLENLQPQKEDLNEGKKIPLWQLAQNIKECKNETVCDRLKLFANAFREKRGLQTALKDTDDAFEWIEQLLKLTVDQFEDKRRELPQINRDYVRDIENLLATGFFHNRKRAGRVLVLNQEYLLLLANLAIGNREKLRFQELVGEFKARGIYLDKQTELELIKFFERIGNVEKMSDSGDAIYVRKTI